MSAIRAFAMAISPFYAAPPSGPIRWHVPAASGRSAPSHVSGDFERVIHTGRAEVVKDGPHRTVYRLDLPDGPCYLKHYRCRGWMRALGHLFRSSAARREFLHSHEIRRRQIPTPAGLAYGELRRYGVVRDSYLLTRAVSGAIALDEYLANHLARLPGSEQEFAKRQIAVALAKLCAAAHRAGVYHNDFHAGNLLLRFEQPNPPSQPELFLIDVPGVRFSGPLSWPATRAALAMLRTSLQPSASQVDCIRFWRAYLAARPELSIRNPRNAMAQIEARAHLAARKILCRRDRRATRQNREFQRIQTRDGVAHAVQDVDALDLTNLMSRPESALRQWRHHPVKLGHGSLVVQGRWKLDGEPVQVAMKRTSVRSVWKAFLARWRGGRARRAWIHGQALLARGIATPRPLAVVLPKRSTPRRDGYMVTEWIAGGENLHLYLWRIASLPHPRRARCVRQLAESLGSLLGRMHGWGVVHGDLKGCNLLIAGRGETLKPYVLDLDSVHIRRRLNQRGQVRDLARLAVSLAAHPWIGRHDVGRFFRSYRRQLPAASCDQRRLWRRAARLAAKKIREFRRQGKPIA